MLPTRMEAERLLEEAEKYNPGPWGNHSRVAAHCAEKIALGCEGMNPEKAYILGLLHDIGRKFRVSYLKHVSEGYSYMMSLGYDYDRLIQLCDALAGSKGVMNIEERMNDVKSRHGNYPQAKWDSNMRLKTYFEEKASKDIYDLVEKDSYTLD